MNFAHRSEGYKLLHGSGLEIGAFHQPAQLEKKCQVVYGDAITKRALC